MNRILDWNERWGRLPVAFALLAFILAMTAIRASGMGVAHADTTPYINNKAINYYFVPATVSLSPATALFDSTPALEFAATWNMPEGAILIASEIERGQDGAIVNRTAPKYFEGGVGARNLTSGKISIGGTAVGAALPIATTLGGTSVVIRITHVDPKIEYSFDLMAGGGTINLADVKGLKLPLRTATAY